MLLGVVAALGSCTGGAPLPHQPTLERHELSLVSLALEINEQPGTFGFEELQELRSIAAAAHVAPPSDEKRPLADAAFAALCAPGKGTKGIEAFVAVPPSESDPVRPSVLLPKRFVALALQEPLGWGSLTGSFHSLPGTDDVVIYEPPPEDVTTLCATMSWSSALAEEDSPELEALVDAWEQTTFGEDDFYWVMATIEERSLQEQGSDKDTAWLHAADGYLRALDPESKLVTVLEPHEAKPLYGYVGLTVELKGTALVVAKVIPESSAEAVGIEQGDILLAVDGVPFEGMDIITAIKAIRGPVGTTVELLVERPPEEEPHSYTLVRGTILLPHEPPYGPGGGNSISNSGRTYSEYPSIACAKLPRPLSTTTMSGLDMFESFVTSMTVEESNVPVEGLVIDLRGHQGGLITSVAAYLDLFIEGGTLFTVGERSSPSGSKKSPWRLTPVLASDPTPFASLPLVVIVDGATRSGAELFAAVIQSTNRGLVIGQPTAGNGAYQVLVSFDTWAGHMIKLTVGFLYDAQGAPFQGTGVVPDIVLTGQSPSLCCSPAPPCPPPTSLPAPEPIEGVEPELPSPKSFVTTCPPPKMKPSSVLAPSSCIDTWYWQAAAYAQCLVDQ